MSIIKELKEKIFGTPVDFNKLLDEGAIVVDVRTHNEFISGNKSGSLNIPLQSLQNSINKLKGKEVILVCKSGMRASQAKQVLVKNGISAYNAGAWQNI